MSEKSKKTTLRKSNKPKLPPVEIKVFIPEVIVPDGYLLNDGEFSKGKPKLQTRSRYLRPQVSFDNPENLSNPTQQSFKDECDIKIIVARHLKQGVDLYQTLPEGMTYADMFDAPTYEEAMNVVADAQRLFMGLDANLRLRFNNDPSTFLEFVHDPKNSDEMISLGLATKVAPTPEAPIQKVQVVNPETSQTPSKS